jgi:hypothetical protein
MELEDLQTGLIPYEEREEREDLEDVTHLSRGQGLNLDDVTNLILQDIEEAENFYNSELSSQCQEAYFLYYGMDTNPVDDPESNKSAYVSRDVFEEVEGLKALLLEVFASNQQAVSFTPKAGVKNTLGAIQSTVYCNDVFYNKNNGEQILRDWFHDGLLVKKGIVKSFWKQQSKKEKQQFQGITEDQLNAIYQQPQIQIKDFKRMPDGTFQGSAIITTDTSFVSVEVIPREDFLIDRIATSAKDFRFIGERRRVYRSDLFAMGFDGNKIYDISPSFYRSALDQEKAARDSVDGTDSYNAFDVTSDQDLINLYECYRKFDLDGDGIDELYKIFVAGDKILSIDEVKKIPYRFFDPYPIAHKFWGLSVADIIKDIQQSKSTTQRQIIDNLALTNNQRNEAVLDDIINPEDVPENRLGQVVWVKKQGSITPIPSAAFDPRTFELLGLFDKNKEGITGNTKLVQGNEPQAMGGNAAASLISVLSSSANRRPIMIARNAASELSELFKDIIEIAEEFDKSGAVQLNSGNGSVTVNPQDLNISEIAVEIKVALTPEQQAKEATILLQFHQLFSSTPNLQMNYGPNQAYLLMKRAMELSGVKGSDLFLMPPTSPEYQQAVASQQQMAQAQQQAAAQEQQLKQQLLIQEGQAKLKEINNKIFETRAKMINDAKVLELERKKTGQELLLRSKEVMIEDKKAESSIKVEKAKILQNMAEIQLKEESGSGI